MILYQYCKCRQKSKGLRARIFMEIKSKHLKIAYKKLKSSLYYDKTLMILRDKLVDFENKQRNIDKYLEELTEQFLSEEKRERLFEEILSSISYYAFPKKIIEFEENDGLVKNYSGNKIYVEDNQYYIDMDVRGHILGALWIILVGYVIDSNIYEHSYGNRIRENLISELSKEPTFSPYLFKPYFQQYESWRDTAMSEALGHLHSSQDVVILTLDFKRFYYSVDVTKELFDNMLTELKYEKNDSEYIVELHSFIYRVIVAYSKVYPEFDGRNILPIGFLPSNIISNYMLNNFDRAVLDGWNPVYYGRYVDDVIIVDKIEQSSELFEKSQEGILKAEDIIDFYLEKCKGWNSVEEKRCQGNSYALFESKRQCGECGNKNKTSGANKEDKVFKLNKLYNPVINDNSELVFNNNKVKSFYFKSGESDALITCFKEKIAKNKSEFRHMPEDETIFQDDDYNIIYDLHNEETINKFRGITGISIDKYEFSKMLGKQLRIRGLAHDDKDKSFEKIIVKALNARDIIENYCTWEKIFEVLIIDEAFDTLEDVVEKICSAIENLNYNKKINENIEYCLKKTLHLYMYSALSRSLALVWGEKIDETIRKLNEKLLETNKIIAVDIAYSMNSQRKAYILTRMVDKSVMPIFVDLLYGQKIFKSGELIKLTNFQQMILHSRTKLKKDYVYYPYLLTMYDLSIISCIEQLNMKKGAFTHADADEMFEALVNRYLKRNYFVEHEVLEYKRIEIEELIVVNKMKDIDESSYCVQVNNEKKNRLRIAIANIKLNHDNFLGIVMDNPIRDTERYRDLSKLVNTAIDEKADMLIMPEAYVPFEWLATLSRTCAKNSLAIVTGVEHIKIKNKVFNLTAVILPYEDSNNKNAFISFHLKKHYAPKEIKEIRGYGLEEVDGKSYELFKWHDCYFPVYCCFELTSIAERALFQSYADLLVAIEWNRDINYYSNIIESLCRDIHCYCIQVNSSDYGDSRIIKPSRSEEKDIVRTKGGKNSTVLVGEIDVGKIREFQLKEYSL